MGKLVAAMLCIIVTICTAGGFTVRAAPAAETKSENEVIEEYLIGKANEFKELTQTSGFKKGVLAFGIVISCMASGEIAIQIKEIMKNRKK